MYILGISCYYHDASAALLKDGKIVAAAQEERFTRKKHDTSFPLNAIRYCLESQDIAAADLDYIGFYEKPLLKFERILHQHLEMFPKSLMAFLGSMPSWIKEKLRILRTIRKKLKYKGDIFFVEHHLAHASSAFFVSPFREAAIVIADGVGEWSTTTISYGKDNKIGVQKELKFPHSVGLLYSTITAYLGFRVNNSEYKVMGLSSYGNMDKKSNPYYKKLRLVIDIKDDGSFRLDMKYFVFHYASKMPSRRLCRLLNGKVRKPGSEISQRHKDIAAALQLITEEAMIKILNHAQNLTGSKNIVMAGGVALNSVLNGKILRNTEFKNIWIQPDAGDSGTSMGVASYIYNSILGKKRNYALRNAYLGPKFSAKDIKSFLEKNNIKHHELKNEKELLKKAANLIYENNVVAWFQDKMEWGPRALGARSILANPCNPEMKNILNEKVKHRESFRPFAPSICREDAKKYFDCDLPLPESTDFMLMVYPIRKKYIKKIPAVAHIDFTGRLQTVRKEQNKLYYKLIKGFGKLSGIPVLLNTSFNVQGKPIVCSPQDAYKCMMGTQIDYLIMDRFLISRKDNL